MENQEILEKKIGNKEMEILKPKKVQILGLKIDPITKDGKEVGKKLTCLCKHPNREDLVNISQVKYLKGDAVKHSGLWINFDEDENLQKGSALVVFLNFMNVKNIKELEGKEAETDLDKSNYLCFKAY